MCFRQINLFVIFYPFKQNIYFKSYLYFIYNFKPTELSFATVELICFVIWILDTLYSFYIDRQFCLSVQPILSHYAPRIHMSCHTYIYVAKLNLKRVINTSSCWQLKRISTNKCNAIIHHLLLHAN